MGVFITNWNPKKWTMPDEVIDEAIQTTADGDLWTGRWSLGSRRRGIVPGDVAVMFHQHHDRGLVASGTFTSEVYRRFGSDGGVGG